MSASLLDVNVLVALFDPAHLNHEDAHRWLAASRKQRWATCPITINGLVRVLTNPAYRSVEATVDEALAHLDSFCSSSQHEFWEDNLSLQDRRVFRPSLIAGPQKITDAYLLGLAVHRHGCLVTFDRSIPLQAVVGATAKHLKVLGIPPV